MYTKCGRTNYVDPANNNLTEEEAETLISNRTTSMFAGNVSICVLNQLLYLLYVSLENIQILEETEAARSNLRELLTRHSELEKIERSLTEVRDMFLRISTLIMDQVIYIRFVCVITIEVRTNKCNPSRCTERSHPSGGVSCATGVDQRGSRNGSAREGARPQNEVS